VNETELGGVDFSYMAKDNSDLHAKFFNHDYLDLPGRATLAL
jgi:hypothetical protein